MTAIAKGASSLRDGGVSVVFHVPYEEAISAFGVHDLQGKTVRLTVTEEGAE